MAAQSWAFMCFMSMARGGSLAISLGPCEEFRADTEDFIFYQSRPKGAIRRRHWLGRYIYIYMYI